jgi:cellulose synthase/poly-beta-1,6-N-acetylglucosamine synthase-like glycosyltransferase
MWEFDFNIQQPLFYLALLFALTSLILLLYYFIVFSRFAFSSLPKNKKEEYKTEAVSVIICARNESHLLEKHLPAFLSQDYPNYEVIVVDDNSNDETEEVIKNFQQNNAHLRYLRLENENKNFFKGKKFPLALGIKEAKNEYLLLSDADCVPASDQWLRQMQSHFSDKKEIVLGYGKYKKTKGFLNACIRFETIHTAIQYFSYALIKMPYMGVGRNLAYKKSLFLKNKGFSSHYHIISGDDDLFINQSSTSSNVAIEFSKEAHTISIPKKTWKTWINQKRRHFLSGKYYKNKHKFFLLTYAFSLFVFYLSFIILMAFTYNIALVLALFIIKQIAYLIIFKKSMIRLNESKLLLISPLIEFFLVFLLPIIIATTRNKKTAQWKRV